MKKILLCGLLALGVTGYSHNIQQANNGVDIKEVTAFEKAVTGYLDENAITVENFETINFVQMTGLINKVFGLAQGDTNTATNANLGDGDDDTVRICNSNYKQLTSDITSYSQSTAGPKVQQCSGIPDEQECLKVANSQGRISMVIKVVKASLSIIDQIAGTPDGVQWCVSQPGTYRVVFESVRVLVTNYCRYFSEKGSFDNGNVQYDNTHICSPNN